MQPQKMKPRMVEILDNACAPGTVIDPDELHRDVEIARTEFYSEAKARKLYGKDAEQCICGEWTHSGGHFDGTYFTCDPEAECNKPGFEAALAQQAQPVCLCTSIEPCEHTQPKGTMRCPVCGWDEPHDANGHRFFDERMTQEASRRYPSGYPDDSARAEGFIQGARWAQKVTNR